MVTFKLLTEAAKELLAQQAKYEAKPTKAESKRMRASIASIQKLAVQAKRDLVEADSK
jgi:hypothetical protein